MSLNNIFSNNINIKNSNVNDFLIEKESIQMKCCKKLSIKDVNIQNKRVLIRVDYNIPMNMQGCILDNSLIIASLPTIQYCLKNKAKSIILISHLDDPGGQPQKNLSLGPVANELNRLLGKTIQFLPNCVGYDVERICSMAKDGDIILLENLKFHPEEDLIIRRSSNPKVNFNDNFIKYINSLSNLGDIYVNDTYSLSHLKYTSLLKLRIPIKVSGLLLKRELDVISLILDNPKLPFVAIIGGLDINENCELIYNILEKVNVLIIVGNLAFVFKHILNNIKIGISDYDKNLVNFVNKAVEKARKYKVELFFPIDYIIANKISKDCKIGITNDNHGIPDGWIGVDIGPKSNVIFNKIILSAKTIFWIGVAGYHEIDKFSKGTRHLIESISESTLQGAISIAAGKDTVKAIAKYKAQNKICHISTGISKTFEYLDCNMLPGVTALTNKI
jgi:phosphoglycerate kinase